MSEVKQNPAEVSAPTSPKLIEIKNEMNAILADFSTAKTNEEKLALASKLTKLQADEKAEEVNIKNAEKAAKAAAVLAELEAKVDSFEQLAIANYLVSNDKKASQEEKDAAKEAFNAIKTEVKNKFLPTHVSTPRAAKTSDGTPSTKGSVTAQIREAIIPMFAAGTSGADVRKHVIKELGFNDGTANAAIRAYEIEIGLK